MTRLTKLTICYSTNCSITEMARRGESTSRSCAVSGVVIARRASFWHCCGRVDQYAGETYYKEGEWEREEVSARCVKGIDEGKAREWLPEGNIDQWKETREKDRKRLFCVKSIQKAVRSLGKERFKNTVTALYEKVKAKGKLKMP